jgi:hypothetical protein
VSSLREQQQSSLEQMLKSWYILFFQVLTSFFRATSEMVFLNLLGAQESIPRKRFRQPMNSPR